MTTSPTTPPTEQQPKEVSKNLPRFMTVLCAVFVVWLIAGAAVWLSIGSLEQRGQFGDMFGAVNALFSGLAMAGVIYAVLLQQNELALQRQELRAQRQEMSRTVGAQLRQIHITIQSMAMEDDDIAKVWAFEENQTLTFKQSAYVNLVLSNWEMHYTENLLSEGEIRTVLDKYFKDSAYFRGFWEGAAVHRANMAAVKGEKGRKFHELAQAAYDKAQ